jgi:tRNA-dihydrouridine synthase
MRTPERLRAILREVRRNVSLPMTVKIRSGWDHETLNALEVARLAEGEGAAMLAIHGRTRRQLYSGDSDWELVGRVREALSIPVLGSGDIVTTDDAMGRLSRAYGDGILIGRGAMGNPWIFAQVVQAAAGAPVQAPSATERVAALSRFRGYLEQALPERAFQGRFRGFACRMVKGLRGSAEARRAIGAAASCSEVEAVFADFVLAAEADRGVRVDEAAVA